MWLHRRPSYIEEFLPFFFEEEEFLPQAPAERGRYESVPKGKLEDLHRQIGATEQRAEAGSSQAVPPVGYTHFLTRKPGFFQS